MKKITFFLLSMSIYLQAANDNILLLVFALTDQPVVLSAVPNPNKECRTPQDLEIQHINNADILSQIPPSISEIEPSGQVKILSFQPSEDNIHTSEDNIHNEVRNRIEMINLGVTNIHEIYPNQLTLFPNVNKICLPGSTKKEIKEDNEKRNPTIEFVYFDLKEEFGDKTPKELVNSPGLFNEAARTTLSKILDYENQSQN